MKKTIILLTTFVLLGCGSLKKDKSSTETETKSDLNASKIENMHEIGGGFTIRPFDPDRGMVVGKDTLYNTILEKHYYDRTKVVHDTIVKKVEVKTDIDTMHKEKDNTMLILGIAGIIGLVFLIIMFVVLWYFNNQIKKLL